MCSGIFKERKSQKHRIKQKLLRFSNRSVIIRTTLIYT